MLSDLTHEQRAAIYYHIFAGCDDWAVLFQIAEGKTRYNKLTDKSKRQTVSKYRRDPKILEAIQEVKYYQKTQEEKKRQETISSWITENENSETGERVNEKTNFLDRDEFLKFLNDRANKITDDKLRNDILKMLSDNLRYKDSDNNEVQEIQRFYTPMNCENCEIYNKCKGCKLSECPEPNK